MNADELRQMLADNARRIRELQELIHTFTGRFYEENRVDWRRAIARYRAQNRRIEARLSAGEGAQA